jgi:transposase
MSKYEEEKKKFGKFALLSNINRSGEEIYKIYKEREEVELAFDAMKNELENDKIYLSDTEGVYGYFFISFISLYLYFSILGMLRESGLVERMSVEEVLHELSKVYLIEYIDGKKRLSEIPKKVEEIDRTLKLNLFPKELQS